MSKDTPSTEAGLYALGTMLFTIGIASKFGFDTGLLVLGALFLLAALNVSMNHHLEV